MVYYHCSHRELDKGDIIEPGNWGKMIREAGTKHRSWNREMLLEEMRVLHFPEKPSRLNSCFCCISLETMNLYQKHLCPNGYIYEVEIMDAFAPFHTGDFNAVEPMPRHHADKYQIAYGYWQYRYKTTIEFEGKAIACTEFLTASRLRVLQKLS